MPFFKPFFKLFIRSFLRSFFKSSDFQTPYLSGFVGQLYLIYRAQSGFKGLVVFISGHLFKNFTLKIHSIKILSIKILILKILTILLLTGIPFPKVSAQNLSREEAMDALYQQHLARLNLDLLTNESGEQSLYLEELWESFAYYLRHPLAVNSATLPELLQLPVIEQIRGGEELMEALVVFRRQQPIQDLYDLLDVPGIGPATYEKLWPFFSLEQGMARLRYWYLRPAFWTQDIGLRFLSSYSQVFKPPTNQVNSTAANPATIQSLLGPRYAQKNRIQLQSAHISAHLAIDKDAGEQAPKLNSAPNTAHLALHQLPLSPNKELMLQTLILGNLSLNTGLGMVMPSSAFNQTRIRTTGLQSLTRLRPRQGFSEESGLRGLATQLQWRRSANQVQLLLLDAQLHELGTGYARTPREVEQSAALAHYPIRGSRLEWATFARTPAPFLAGIEAYQSYASPRSLDWGLDLHSEWRDLHVSSALLFGSHRSGSMLFSLRYTPRQQPLGQQSNRQQPLRLRLRSYALTENKSLLHREYPSFGSAWGLFAASRAQKGWDLSVQYELSPWIHAFASLAASQEPLPSGYDRYPERRTELRLGLDYEFPQLPLTLQSSWQYKPQQEKSRGSLQAEFQASEQLRIRSRLLVASATINSTPATSSNPTTTTNSTPPPAQKNHQTIAYLLYHEIRLQPKTWLQLDARYTQFDSPSHETRLYAYESDLRYQFSVGQWQGQGHQYYVMLNIRPFTAKLHIQLKYSQAEYPGQSAIGSGPTQVLGPTKREIKAQILLRW
jgi:hypothetical protein